MQPLIRWPGGKRKYVPLLQSIYEEAGGNRLIVEPFAGGAAISLGLAHSSPAWVNDINNDLINFYFCAAFSTCQFSPGIPNNEAGYYKARNDFNQLNKRDDRHQLTPNTPINHARARLFYYLSQTCFNGLIRYNSKGEMNTPFGNRKKVDFKGYFPEFAAHTKGWFFSSLPFYDMPIKKDQFLFLDPPYWGGFTSYWSEGFSWDDQVELADWAAGHTGPVVATNSWCKEIKELWESYGFTVKKKLRDTSISGDSRGRGSVAEALIYGNIK